MVRKTVNKRVPLLLLLFFWTISANGYEVRNLKQLTNWPAAQQECTFNASGTLIAYRNLPSPLWWATCDIWVMNLDGSGNKKVTFDSSGEFNPRFVPDGRISYVKEFGSNEYDIWIANADGSNPCELIGGPIRQGGAGYDWHPSSLVIAYTNEYMWDAGEIWTANAEGCGTVYNKRQLTNHNIDGYSQDFPVWSHSGDKIAYGNISTKGAVHHVWIMNSDGTGKRQITSGPGEQPMFWWPDDSYIGYGKNYEVWLHHMATGRDELLLSVPNGQIGQCDLSPDGTKLVFQLSDASGTHIWIGDVTGTTPGVTVRGTVYDQVTNQPLPGATVEAQGKQPQTGTDGRYEITNLSPGNITVTASKTPGCEPNSVTLPLVQPGQICEGVNLSLVPNEQDPDGDRLDNYHEMLCRTDHQNPDSDSDGVLDGYEYAIGTDPCDAKSWFSNGVVLFGKNPLSLGDPYVVVNQESLDLLEQVNTLGCKLNFVKFWLSWRDVETEGVLPGVGLTVSGVNDVDEIIDEYAFPEKDHPHFDFEGPDGKVVWGYYDYFLQQLKTRENLRQAALPWIGEGSGAPQFNGSQLSPGEWDFLPDFVRRENYLARLYLHVRGAVRRYGRPQAKNNWQAKDRIHFWNMENELNWTFMWRTIDNPPQFSWLDGTFTTQVIQTISEAIKAEDSCAIRTHNFNTALLIPTYVPSNAPTWAIGLGPLLEWQHTMEVIGIGAYPNYLFSDPVLGFTIPLYVFCAAQISGKPAMVVESGYPTSPYLGVWPYEYTEVKQAAYILEAIPGTQLVGSQPIISPHPQLPHLNHPYRSGIGFTYFALNTAEEAETYYKLPDPRVVENYWGLKHQNGNYKQGFFAYKAVVSASSLVDSTQQFLNTSWVNISSSLQNVSLGETAILDLPIKIGKEMYNLVVNWLGSTLAVKLYKPNGSLYGEWESGEPPILIDLRDPEVGTWRLEVKAVDVPFNNYPFLVVLEVPKLPCEQVIGLLGYEFIDKKRLNRTEFEYTFRLRAANSWVFDLKDVIVQLVGEPNNTTVLDDTVKFSLIKAGTEVLSDDTFTIRTDRAIEGSPSDVVWKICDCKMQRRSDFGHDWSVDFRDFATLAEAWLNVGDNMPQDVYPDGKIDVMDLMIFSEEWLR